MLISRQLLPCRNVTWGGVEVGVLIHLRIFQKKSELLIIKQRPHFQMLATYSNVYDTKWVMQK